MPPNQGLPPVLIGTGALASSRLSTLLHTTFLLTPLEHWNTKDLDLNHELEAAYYW